MTSRLKSFLSFLSIMDVFKYTFFFRIGKSIKTSTFFSVFISILVLSPLIAYFYVLAVETLNYQNPKINIQEYDVNNRPFMEMNSSNFRMAMRIQFYNRSSFEGRISDFFDINIFELRTEQQNSHMKITGNDLNKNFKMEACTKSDFLDFPDYYQLNLKNAVCLKNHSFTVGAILMRRA